MKRTVVLLLLLALTLSTAACAGEAGGGGGGVGGPKTALAYDTYSQATEAMSNIESLIADTDISMTMSFAGQDMSVEMSGIIKQVILSETELEMQMNMRTITMGEEIDFITYYKDGVYYMELEEQKMCMEVPLEHIQAQANTEALAFPDTAIKEQQATEKDGGQELYFILDGSTLTEAITKQIGSIGDMLGEQSELTIGDIEYKVFVDAQGDLKTTWMSFEMEMNILEEAVPISMEASLNYLQINNVSIDFPADLDTYLPFGDLL